MQVQTALGAIVRAPQARELPCGVFGSFGWSGEAVDELENRLKVCVLHVLQANRLAVFWQSIVQLHEGLSAKPMLTAQLCSGSRVSMAYLQCWASC